MVQSIQSIKFKLEEEKTIYVKADKGAGIVILDKEIKIALLRQI